MYGRIYTVRATPTAIGAALDVFELRPATDKPVVVHKVVISPKDSEVNQQAQVTVRTLPATVTSGSGGSTPTVGGKSSADAASISAVTFGSAANRRARSRSSPAARAAAAMLA